MNKEAVAQQIQQYYEAFGNSQKNQFLAEMDVANISAVRVQSGVVIVILTAIICGLLYGANRLRMQAVANKDNYASEGFWIAFGACLTVAAIMLVPLGIHISDFINPEAAIVSHWLSSTKMAR